MSELGDGGPAFPGGLYEHAHAGKNDRSPYNDGMSLRDFFAGQVMGHLISLSIDGDGGWCPDNVARGCYNLADAMLKARGQRP